MLFDNPLFELTMADQIFDLDPRLTAVEDKIDTLSVELAKMRDSQAMIRETMEGLLRGMASLQASSVQREPPPLPPLVPPPQNMAPP